MDVLLDSRRILNADETAFFLCPKGSKALALKGSRNVYNSTANNGKDCITTLVTGMQITYPHIEHIPIL